MIETLAEREEADYCIIVKSGNMEIDGKLKIIVDQIEDLRLRKGEHFNVYFYPFRDRHPEGKVAKLMKWLKGDSSPPPMYKALITIKIPQDVLDAECHNNKMSSTLRVYNAKFLVKTRFINGKKEKFMAFDATTKLEIIEEFLKKEIDFE